MNDRLVALIKSWRRWMSDAPTFSESDRLSARELNQMFYTALYGLHDSFFTELAQAVRTIEKGKPHDPMLFAFRLAYLSFKEEGEEPTWAQVVERAKRELRLDMPSKTTLKRIRRELGLDLPNRPSGRPRNRGQK